MHGLARSVMGLVALVILQCCVGCAKWPPSITTRLDQSLSQPASGFPFVEVHLVAIPASEYQNWTNMSVSQYWAANGPSRSSNPMRYVVRLTPEHPIRTIPSDDPIWQKWSEPSVAYLMVLADLPNVESSATDPRRQSIPLDREHKNYPPQITITIARNGIRVSPEPSEKRELFGAGRRANSTPLALATASDQRQ